MEAALACRLAGGGRCSERSSNRRDRLSAVTDSGDAPRATSSLKWLSAPLEGRARGRGEGDGCVWGEGGGDSSCHSLESRQGTRRGPKNAAPREALPAAVARR